MYGITFKNVQNINETKWTIFLQWKTYLFTDKLFELLELIEFENGDKNSFPR